MNSKHQLAIVALLVAFAVFLILSKPLWWKETAPAVDPDMIGRMNDRLAALEEGQDSSRKALEILQDMARRTADRSRISSTPDGVMTTGAAHADTSAGDATSPGGRPATRAGATAALTLDAAIAALQAAKSYEDREALWKRIREAGLTDEVIKALEAKAAARSKDPDAQTELGNAYLKKIQEVPQGPEAGLWANKADQSFDRALELDPEHWEARFTKAVSLTFWPAAFGKQTEAIKHFETLLAQQERQAPRSGFDNTYYFLGNMYQQMGQRDQAVATWQRGLKLYPDNAALQQQLANAGR